MSYLQLLRKAGWRGAGGLGAQEQGIASPIAAWQQLGRSGIGLSSLQKTQRRADLEEQTPPGEAQQGQQPGKQPATPAEEQQCNKGKARRTRAPKREWETVKVEEAVESKVKRWRQILQVSQS